MKDVVSERPRERQRRLHQGWTDAGYTDVNGRYYRTDEVVLANRARQMAGVLEHPEPPPPSDDPPKAETTPPPPDAAPEVEPPGFVRQWWLHAALVLAALVLIGVVVKTILMAG